MLLLTIVVIHRSSEALGSSIKNFLILCSYSLVLLPATHETRSESSIHEMLISDFPMQLSRFCAEQLNHHSRNLYCDADESSVFSFHTH